MSLTANEILDLLEKAKAMGITNIKLEGFEANFGPEKPPQDVKTMTPEEILKALPPEHQQTDEEILFWSTGHYDELQEKKEMTNE